jgi:hypothetical protein
LRLKNRLRFGLGIVALAAATTAALLLAFASGGNAASAKTCTQLSSTKANCLDVFVAPNVLSSNQTGLFVAKFKNAFANATATHTVVAAIMPTGATATSLSSSAPATCSLQSVSCNFGSVPGGATVALYVQFTTSLQSGSSLGAIRGAVSFDESNGNTGTTTNDTFTTSSDATLIAPAITGGHGGDQGGLCSSNLAQSGFTTTNLTGQQVNVSDLPAAAQGGFPCTPVSGGSRAPTAAELSACGGSCPAPTAFVFFPVLTGNATVPVTLVYPTLPSGVTAWQKTPLFEFLGTGSTQTLVRLVACGVTPNPSPDTCIIGMSKFGSKGVQFTLSVAGNPFDGRYTP